MRPLLLKCSFAIVMLICKVSAVQAQTSFNPLEHVVRNKAFWKSFGISIDRTIENKVCSTPLELLDYLQRLNVYQGFVEQPEIVTAPLNFQSDIKMALEELPIAVKNLVNHKLIGIFLVRNLGSAALTTSVFDEHDKPSAGFVILDIDQLGRKANEWATWKENLPFISNGSNLKIGVEIESSKNNSQRNAIQYVLLHEFGHIISFDDKNQPPLESKYLQNFDPAKFRFSGISWKLKKGRYVSIFEREFSDRSKIVFYGSHRTKVPVQNSQRIYRLLRKTSFPTLYSVTHPADDFAESFASYVHTVMMHRPYRVTLLKDNRVIETLTECWNEERCKEKRKLLDEYFH